VSGRGGLNASQIVCPLSYNYISYSIYDSSGDLTLHYLQGDVQVRERVKTSR